MASSFRSLSRNVKLVSSVNALDSFLCKSILTEHTPSSTVAYETFDKRTENG